MKTILKDKTYFYIIVAYIFSVLIHSIWVYQFNGYEPFIWNNQFMINTNDGYYWAEGARDFIKGEHQKYDLSPIYEAPSILTAFFYKILPFSFETVIFYISAFLSSLIVIPVILIAKELKQLEMGFIAALISSITWSYYNRTLVGYYDTDMLNIVLPTFLLWSLMVALYTKKEKYLIYTGLEIILYRSWYPQSYSLEFAFFTLIALYMGYQYYKKQDFTYTLTLLTFMMFSMMGLNGFIRLIIITGLFYALKKGIFKQYLYHLFGVSIAIFFLTGGFSPIWGKLKVYIFRDSVEVTKDILQLHFFSVMQTVREAGKIPFEVFANRISGHLITFVLSIIGYILMVRKYPVMFLGLPMIGLGFLAYSGGLRFTIYAIVPLAFGIAFLIIKTVSFFQHKILKYIFIVVSSILVLIPNIYHAWQYRVPTVFTKNEVKNLDSLKKIASREDYVISWWDYGYPIRYYSDTKTLVDGGKHSGSVNFPVSYILTHEQIKAAKLARLDVEYTEKKFHLIDEEKIEKDSLEYTRSNIAQMTLDYGFNNVNDFLASLELPETKLPKKTRNIYLYLPKRMINIFPTVAKFSSIDLMNGKSIEQPLFLVTQPVKKQGSVIELAYGRNHFLFDLQKATIKAGNKELPVSTFIVTRYDKTLKLQKKIQNLSFNGFVVIYMESYNIFLIMDQNTYKSTYVQLFVLENYNKKYYEPVILSPEAKIYKLKI